MSDPSPAHLCRARKILADSADIENTLAALLAMHDERVRELLEHNMALDERCRQAEAAIRLARRRAAAVSAATLSVIIDEVVKLKVERDELQRRLALFAEKDEEDGDD